MKLITTEKNTFVVVSLDGTQRHEITDKDTAISKLTSMGVDVFEIEDAMVEMEFKKHDIAHFGINGTFMFTEQSKGK